LNVASRLPSEETNMLGWSIFAFRMSEILGVNGIKMTAYAANSSSATAPNPASPLMAATILTRLLKVGSIATLKVPTSRRTKRLARPAGRTISATIASYGLGGNPAEMAGPLQKAAGL
jgi:hypothetical protein